MIFDCPACASALIYNPTLGKMECLSCGNAYDMTNFDDKKETQELKRKELSLDEDMVEYNIYSCTACGAEIAVNGVESSTFADSQPSYSAGYLLPESQNTSFHLRLQKNRQLPLSVSACPKDSLFQKKSRILKLSGFAESIFLSGSMILIILTDSI